jgi:hypothetical protein
LSATGLTTTGIVAATDIAERSIFADLRYVTARPSHRIGRESTPSMKAAGLIFVAFYEQHMT